MQPGSFPFSCGGGWGSVAAAGTPVGSALAAEASSTAANEPPAARGVRARISHAGRRRWRIGCSINTYEAMLTARVTASRSTRSPTPLAPVVSSLSHRNSGKCHR